MTYDATFDAFRKLVARMRAAQTRWFSKHDNLDEAKRLEREVDHCLLLMEGGNLFPENPTVKEQP